MKQEKAERPNVDRIVFVVAAVLMVALLLITVLDRCGLKLLSPDISLQGGLLLVVLLVCWGLWHLTRKIRAATLRKVVTLLLAFVVLLVAMFCSAQIGQYSLVILPQYRRTVTSPGGRNAVVLRQVDMGTDEETMLEVQRRMEARRAERLAADPEGDADFVYSDYGYKFTLYPQFLGVFYKAGADSQGAVYIGADTQARLNYDWVSEDELRVTLDDPEVGDEGEVVLRF